MILSVRFLSVLAFAAALSWAARSDAQNAGAAPAPALDILDGRRFAGEMIPEGKSSGRADDFIFADGEFHSRVCLDWGFTPGPYWLRVEDGRLHFLARLTSAENGVMTYKGTVDGPNMEARVEWIKPRWYWTMERNFSFRGSTDAAAAASGQ